MFLYKNKRQLSEANNIAKLFAQFSQNAKVEDCIIKGYV